MKTQSNVISLVTQPRHRRLSILRHAKAEEGDGDDLARKLNERGLQDAARMGDFLKEKNWLPDLVLCSTARRTRQTLGQLKVTIPTILASRAYLASAGEWMHLVQEADDTAQHILIVGHNPGLHQLTVTLAGEYLYRDDEQVITTKFPTCTFVSLELPIKRWRELSPASGKLDLLAVGSKL